MTVKEPSTEPSYKEVSSRNRFPDYTAVEKHYRRQHFKDLHDIHALVDCRIEWLDACWKWLYK